MVRRPKIHFTPERNWMNDPNGMVYLNGKYHLFYQYYPDDIVWGPMHWGHAVTVDLIHWEHMPIALYPDKLGYIFSGSCIFDKDNVSGLGARQTPPLIAFFTSHNPDNGIEQQSIAYSLDTKRFVKYSQNPIIPNTEKKDFRDPKVFVNSIKGGFSLALAVGTKIEFYHSNNLVKWSKTGEFLPGINGFKGICECPDCFSVETEAGMKWVLLISMCLEEEEIHKAVKQGMSVGKHVVQYYIGEFDGDTFRDTCQKENALLVDYGTDYYAANTFTDSPDRIVIGWGENWEYVLKMAGVDYCGKMTIPRYLSLKNTIDGYYLCSKPVGIENMNPEFTIRIAEKEGTLKEHNTIFTKELKESCFRIIVEEIGIGEIHFTNCIGEAFSIWFSEREIIVDRSCVGVKDKIEEDGLRGQQVDILKTKRLITESGRTEIIYDEGYFEIFAENGMMPFSVMSYPSCPYDHICVIWKE